ncbi:MAG: gliding motility protein GldN [bacterium]
MKTKAFLVFSLLIFGVVLTSSSQVFNNPSGVIDSPTRDGVYDRTTISQVDPIPYVYLREADIVWTRRIWRILDMREKMNQPFYYPRDAKNGWKRFAEVVLDGLSKGDIQAYSTNDDQFSLPVTYEQIMKENTKTVTKRFTKVDQDGNQVEYDTTFPQLLNNDDVKWLRIKEDYYFDRQRSQMDVRILGLALVIEKFAEDGSSQGLVPLFWIYLPECRKYFAKNEIFNLKNGAAGRMTYDDVFTKRMFSSYIMKEENVYDRKIDEYAVGKDALMEAENIKNRIADYEMTLWEY